MYSLLFILLVTPAFGRPTSDQLGSELQEAVRNIQEIYARQGVDFDEQYFQDYNEAKSYLLETRQKLMGLAQRTVKDVRDLKVVLEHLDESTGSVFLTIFTNRMKDLMSETGMIEAREKYESAVKTFENLNSFIKTNNRNLQSAADKELKEKLLKNIDLITYNLAVAITLAANPDLNRYQQYEKESLETIKDRMLESENNFDKSINEAIDILDDEIDMISIWNKSARVVSKNIDDYPAEILRELKSVKTIFINGLDDLKNVAEQYLSQPTDLLGK